MFFKFWKYIINDALWIFHEIRVLLTVLLTKIRARPYYFVIRVFYRITGITLTIFKVKFLAKKPMTVKLEKEMLEDIDNECEGLGCNRTDFVIEAVQEKLEGKNEEPKEEPKLTIKDIPEPKPTIGTIKTTSDGSKYKLKSIQDNDTQLWEEIEEPKEVQNARIIDEPLDNSNKPPIEMVLFNGKYIPFAKRYNI